MASRIRFLLAVLLISAGAWGQGAAEPDEDVVLAPKELSRRIHAARQALPELKAAPTEGQLAAAPGACKLFERGRKRVGELDDRDRAGLADLGVRGGFFAGRPETMLAGAKLLWERTDKDKPARSEAVILTWAGIFAGDPKAAKEALDQMAAHPADESFAGWAKMMRPVAEGCGKPVDASCRLLNGKRFSTAASRGKVVGMEFWATWCGPCLQTVPLIKAFHEERKADKNFVLLSLSQDRSEAAAKQGIREHGMKWLQAMDPGLARRFGVRGIPHMLILSPAGHLIWRGHPAMMDRVKWVTDFARRQAAAMKAAPAAAKDAPPKPAPAPAPRPKPPPPPAAPKDPKVLADQKYRLAKVYLNAGLKDKARGILRDVIEKYPDTPAAAEARRTLAGIK